MALALPLALVPEMVAVALALALVPRLLNGGPRPWPSPSPSPWKRCPTHKRIEEREKVEKLESRIGAVALVLAVPLALVPEMAALALALALVPRSLHGVPRPGTGPRPRPRPRP